MKVNAVSGGAIIWSELNTNEVIIIKKSLMS